MNRLCVALAGIVFIVGSSVWLKNANAHLNDPLLFALAEPDRGPTEKPVAPEINSLGDIPDNQVFVKYTSPQGGYQLQVPEGWARTINGADVTFTITLLAFLGIFLASSAATVTSRAAASVPVDWQVLLLANANESLVQDAIGKTAACEKMKKVGYAEIQGFSAATGDTVQTTGPGKVLGISRNYRMLSLRGATLNQCFRCWRHILTEFWSLKRPARIFNCSTAIS